MADTTDQAKETPARTVGDIALGAPSLVVGGPVEVISGRKVRQPGISEATLRGILAASKRIKGEIPGSPITSDSAGVLISRAMKVLRRI